MPLKAAFALVGRKLQEAADGLSHNDLQKWLSDACSEMEGGGWLVDFIGDSESGDAIYSCCGDLMRAPYEIRIVNGKSTATIDTENAIDVLPRTTYEPEADEDDHYASMESAKLYQSGAAKLVERFISKKTRDTAAPESFAGKGKSYPIMAAADVGAAVHAMGRAGTGNYDAGTLKRNIIRIAKAKGFASSLPKAWQEGDQQEGARPAAATGAMKLVESAATTEAIVLREARADYEIKLIAPGKGASAFYPEEVLKRDGPRVFKASTHVYLNHATAAEEEQRPEGDVRNLAGVLTSDAAYHESHPKGPGLYARMKVFADHAQLVEDKAPHVGMSIRASGVAEAGQKRDGLPVLKELTGAESVDVVTRAGAGGMILTEAAKPAKSHEEDSDMDAAELKTLKESLAKMSARALRSDAKDEAIRLLADVSIRESAKALIIESVIDRGIPAAADGELDKAKLKEAIEAETRRVATALFPEGARITGMGPSGATAPNADEAKRIRKEAKRASAEERDEAIEIFESLGMPKAAAELSADWRERA